MKFMVKAREAQRVRAREEAQELLEELEADASSDSSDSDAGDLAELAAFSGEVEDAAVAALEQAVNTDLPALAAAAPLAQAGPAGDGTVSGTQFAHAAQTACPLYTYDAADEPSRAVPGLRQTIY